MEAPLLENEVEFASSAEDGAGREPYEADEDGAELVLRMPPLLSASLALCGSPSLRTGTKWGNTCAKAWRCTTTVLVVLFFVEVIVEVLDGAAHAFTTTQTVVFTCFSMVLSILCLLLLVAMRQIVDTRCRRGSLHIPPLDQGAPSVQSVTKVWKHIQLRRGVMAVALLPYLVVVAGLSRLSLSDACPPAHVVDCRLYVIFGILAILFAIVVTAAPSVTALLLSFTVDGLMHRITQPLAVLTAAKQQRSDDVDKGASEMAACVWNAYENAVRQTDSLSKLLRPAWISAVALTTCGAAGGVYTTWVMAFSLGDTHGVVLWSCMSASFIVSLGILLREAALIYSRATVPLTRMLAIDGDLPRNKRAALQSILRERPIAFTVRGLEITNTLMVYVVIGSTAGLLSPLLTLATEKWVE